MKTASAHSYKHLDFPTHEQMDAAYPLGLSYLLACGAHKFLVEQRESKDLEWERKKTVAKVGLALQEFIVGFFHDEMQEYGFTSAIKGLVMVVRHRNITQKSAEIRLTYLNGDGITYQVSWL